MSKNSEVMEQVVMTQKNDSISGINTFAKYIPKEYRKRWNIKTGSRV